MYPDISPRNPLWPATSGIPGNGVRRLLGAAMRNWQRRKMIATFDAMDDWVLSDIGLRREDIVRTVDSFDQMRTPALALAAPDQMRSIEYLGRPDRVARDIRKAA